MPSEIISAGGVSPGDDAPDAIDDLQQDGETRGLSVPAGLHGERLDRALALLIPEFSRSYLQQQVTAQGVQLNGRVASKAAARVSAGDRLTVTLRPTAQAMAFVPQPMEIPVVYEDEDLLVIDKPAGLVVHPAAGNWSGTLLNGLLARHPEAAALPRAGIVHRLDKDTSGLMLVAKSRLAMDALVRAIADRSVRRQYLALAHGRWGGLAVQDVDQPIGRDPRNRLRMAVLGEGQAGARAARTTFCLLGQAQDTAALACRLHTGRTHQIRVHLAWLGHPLLADALYGGRAAHGMTRQALHATRLELAHPVSGQPLRLDSRPPADFCAAMQALGLRYNEASSLCPGDS
ncbi:MAG: RluA family pseudouridine synthase [Burkholderiales bacterium]|nr:MAG: RluA family pseudouridine synthase [Burkholderiales bacterium]